MRYERIFQLYDSRAKSTLKKELKPIAEFISLEEAKKEQLKHSGSVIFEVVQEYFFDVFTGKEKLINCFY